MAFLSIINRNYWRIPLATSSNCQKCMEQLRKDGYTLVQLVEHWNSFALRNKEVSQFIKGKKIDLYGIIDVLACKPGAILGVQSCSNYNDITVHIRKYAADNDKKTNLINWLEAGGKYELWAYERKDIPGVRKKWHVRIQKLMLSDVLSWI